MNTREIGVSISISKQGMTAAMVLALAMAGGAEAQSGGRNRPDRRNRPRTETNRPERPERPIAERPDDRTRPEIGRPRPGRPIGWPPRVEWAILGMRGFAISESATEVAAVDVIGARRRGGGGDAVEPQPAPAPGSPDQPVASEDSDTEDADDAEGAEDSEDATEGTTDSSEGTGTDGEEPAAPDAIQPDGSTQRPRRKMRGTLRIGADTWRLANIQLEWAAVRPIPGTDSEIARRQLVGLTAELRPAARPIPEPAPRPGTTTDYPGTTATKPADKPVDAAAGKLSLKLVDKVFGRTDVKVVEGEASAGGTSWKIVGRGHGARGGGGRGPMPPPGVSEPGSPGEVAPMPAEGSVEDGF